MWLASASLENPGGREPQAGMFFERGTDSEDQVSTQRAERGNKHLSTQKAKIFHVLQLVLSSTITTCLHTPPLLCSGNCSAVLPHVASWVNLPSAEGTPTLLQVLVLTWDLLSRLLPRLVGAAPALCHERLRTTAEDKKPCSSRQSNTYQGTDMKLPREENLSLIVSSC